MWDGNESAYAGTTGATYDTGEASGLPPTSAGPDRAGTRSATRGAGGGSRPSDGRARADVPGPMLIMGREGGTPRTRDAGGHAGAQTNAATGDAVLAGDVGVAGGAPPPAGIGEAATAAGDALPPTPAEGPAVTRNDPQGGASASDESPTASPDDGLTPRQRIAVAALVGGRTCAAAARQAGVSRKTLFLWRRQPAFAAAVRDLSRGALEATAARAGRLMLRATRNLAESLRGPERAHWSMRVLNSRRVWEIAESLSVLPEDAAEPTRRSG